MLKSRLNEIKAVFENRSGRSWNDLVSQCSELVLFGSWSVGKEYPQSDLDLLCIDYSRRGKSPKLDLLCYPKKFLLTQTWLTSELASHIAHYGVWLKGSGSWRKKVRVTPETLAKKREQILIRFVRLEFSLKSGPLTVWAKEQVKLRRDLQRLACLSAGKAPPPSALLDERWNGAEEKVIIHKLLRKAASELVGDSRVFGFDKP